MIHQFYIYTIDDLIGDPNIITTGGVATVAFDATPDLIQVDDNTGDSYLDVFTSFDSDQILAADLVIDGDVVGAAGMPVSIIGEAGFTDISAGSSEGTFSAILVNGVVVGFVSTIELEPGHILSISAATPGGTAVLYDDLAACFTRGTKIMCEHGEVLVQDLLPDDLVVTRSHGLKPIRWVGSQKTRGHGDMAPIRFKAGTVDNSTDILVSPMHRMLVKGPRAEALFGAPELLAHAKDLRDGDRIFTEPVDSVEYFHILFDDHQIISAHGCWSESFAPHHEAINAFEQKARDEVLKLFPQLGAGWQDALPTLSAAEAAIISKS